ncbi:hypothetical protein M409DRAFT_71438 [Zasmidium cellare ATCC 36951]|uniref:Zn(2)-C6 fungal-type domain-containing protein n=1 Tax=Zasmidium cellare ATCC 36951 TaxID=1080233 RepID=A0A6A6BZF8_ZASCE|nr:uncharacterized protein M409DRAFT_71438 [Zasmidium cellare ATCC 36951]KAF2158806.1 hypothetical protein M409DRAFT_71438 [Zasmidium cellare ATCC 36951]
MERKGARGVPADMVHRWSKAPLSCRLCRAKKLRCDRAQPCSNCAQRNADCEYTESLPSTATRSDAARTKTTSKREQPLPPKEPFHPSLQRLEQIVLQQSKQGPQSSAQPSGSPSGNHVTAPVAGSADGQEPAWVSVGGSDASSPMNRVSKATSLVDEMSSGQLQQSVVAFGSGIPSDVEQLISPDPTTPDAILLARCLPPLSQAMELFNHFMHAIHPTFGVLHVPSTRALLQQIYQNLLDGDEPNMAGLALIYSVFAGAALAWSTELLGALQATQENAEMSFTTYSQLAVAILDNRQHPVPNSTVALQAFSTLGYVLAHSDGFSQTVHLLRSREMHMSRSLQIHRLDTAKRREERRLKGFNIIETEAQRRLWWHMVSSDWLLALSSGANEGVYLHQPRHMNVNYPSNIDDETIPASGTDFGLPISVPTSTSAFLCRIRLSEFCREVVDTLPPFAFHETDSSSSHDSEIDYDLILDLDTRLQYYIDALPFFLKNDQESLQQSVFVCHERPYIAWQRTFLHFAINMRICRLHRPFHLAGFTDPKYAYSRARCIRAAENVLELRRSMEDVAALINLNPSRFWLIVQHVFQAAIILAIDVSLKPDSPEAIPRRTEVLAACEMLQRSQHESATLKKAIQKNTRTLYRVLQNQTSLPKSHPALGSGIAASTSGFEYKDNLMNADTFSNGASLQHLGNGADALLYSAPTMMPDLTMPLVQDTATSMNGGNWPDATQTQQFDDESWGKLWSDVFNKGLDLDPMQWSSLMDGMGFSDISGEER